MNARGGVVALVALWIGCGGGASPSPTVVSAPEPTGSAVAVPRAPVAAPSRRASPREEHPRATVDGALGLYVGQPIDAAERLVGGTVTHVPVDDERVAWESNGYRTDEEPIFALGFDVVSEFNQPSLPVYKLYAARGVVRIIKFSAYVVDQATVAGRRVGFEPSCFLLATPETANETFGTPTHVEEVPDQNRVVFHYVDAGLSVLAEDGRIQVFDVFGALSVAEEKRVRDALWKKSSRTRS